MSDDTPDKPAAKKAARKTTRRKTTARKKPVTPKAEATSPLVEAAGTVEADATATSSQPVSPKAPRAATSAGLITVPMAVRWRDLDAFNHVNNSKYLSYLEEARLQWMLTVPGMGMDDHVAPVVAAAQLNYRRPIAWPAQVEIELSVERLGNTSLTIGHRIVDANDRGVLFCDGHVVMVWIDRDSGSAAALPDAVREACGG